MKEREEERFRSEDGRETARARRKRQRGRGNITATPTDGAKEKGGMTSGDRDGRSATFAAGWRRIGDGCGDGRSTWADTCGYFKEIFMRYI